MQGEAPADLPMPPPELMHKEHHVHHPAYPMYVVSFVFLALTVLFGFISVFIPWAVKDIAVQTRAWAYPFKTCLEDTFSKVNQETCVDNDFIQPGGAPLTQSSRECKGYVLATIAFVFLYVLPGVIALIMLGYILEHLWWSPIKLAWATDGLLCFVSLSSMLAWIMFIIYMEKVCVPNSIFPVSPGYSYGFIMTLFSTAFTLVSVATAFLGTFKLKKYKKEHDELDLDGLKFDEMPVQEPPPPMFFPALPPSPYQMPTPRAYPMAYAPVPYWSPRPMGSPRPGFPTTGPSPMLPPGASIVLM